MSKPEPAEVAWVLVQQFTADEMTWGDMHANCPSRRAVQANACCECIVRSLLLVSSSDQCMRQHPYQTRQRRTVTAPSKPPPVTAPRLSKAVGVAFHPESQLAGIHRSPACRCSSAAGCCESCTGAGSRDGLSAPLLVDSWCRRALH